MKATITALLRAGGLALLIGGGVAFASHVEPEVAKKFVTSLVTAYPECAPVAADTLYLGTFPACSNPQPANPACTFDTGGSGKAKVSVVTGSVHDIKVVAKLVGLDCPNDQVLTALVTIRVTLEDCDNNLPCTVSDAVLPVGTCTVENGICRITGTINEFLPTMLRTGNMTAVEITGCTLAANGIPTFSCGLLVP